MTETDSDTDLASAHALLALAYTELVEAFQFLEMTLWEIQSARIKSRAMRNDSAIEYKVQRWHEQATLGMLVGELSSDRKAPLPDHLRDALSWAVRIRNLYTHRFLRELRLTNPSADDLGSWAETIAGLLGDVRRLDEEVTRHGQEVIGLPTATDLDAALLASIEQEFPSDRPLIEMSNDYAERLMVL